MDIFLKVFLVVLLALAFIGWLADRRAAANRPNVTPGLSFLPGDIKYQSPNNVRIYFPIVTSIVLSVLLTLILTSAHTISRLLAKSLVARKKAIATAPAAYPWSRIAPDHLARSTTIQPVMGAL